MGITLIHMHAGVYRPVLHDGPLERCNFVRTHQVGEEEHVLDVNLRSEVCRGYA